MRRSMSPHALVLLALVALLSATTIITTTTHAQQLVFTQAPQSPWVGREHGGLNVIRNAFFVYNVGGMSLQAGTNSWILFGGTSSSYNSRSTENDNDVWVSTNAGTTWFQVSGRYYDSTARQWIDAPDHSQSSYTTYRASVSCSDSKSVLYVIGGEYDSNTTTVPVNDVYVSIDGGASWMKRGNSGLTPRAYPNCVIDSNRNVYVLNGILDYNDVVGDRRNPSNDVWVSSDLGATFRLVAQAPYSPRGAAASLFVVDKGLGNPKLIYVMGGWSELNNTQSLKRDVWMSSDAGLSWTNIAALSAWGMRADMSVTSTELGFLVLYGGRTVSGGSEWVWSNEVFISADGGVSWWGQAAGGVPAMAFAQLGIHGSDENLVIAGGGLPLASQPWSRTPTNMVFQSQLALSDTVETLSLFNVPGRVTTSCIGYYTCKNELAFTASTERADFTPRTRFTVHSLQQRHTVRLSSGSSLTLDPNSWVLFSGLTSYGDIARSPTDMWVSQDKGASWKQVGGVRNTSIPSSVSVFSNRAGACSFADQDDNLYVTGGVIWGSPKIMFNDTWVSGDVASSWSRRGTLVGYRAFHSCVADSDGNLYLMLGENEVYDFLADVQISRDRGASWSTLVSRTAIAARTAATLAVWSKRVNGGASDVFYLTAGMTNQLRNGNNDVFVSTDMATWSRVTSAAAWRARADATLAVSNNGILVMTGGRTVGTGAWYFFSDVWVSFDGGLAWDVIEDAMYAPRKFPSVFFTQDDNKMVVVGGDNAALLNDVWVSRSFSDDQYLIRVSEAEGVAPCPQSSASSNVYASPSVCDALYGNKASGSSSSAGTNALIAIVVIIGVGTIGWVLYSLRAHGEVRIPCTERSCNCCNSALRRDTLFDDEFALHKGTGKFKQQSGMSRSLMDD